jgi:hypothetical protein
MHAATAGTRPTTPAHSHLAPIAGGLVPLTLLLPFATIPPS